ncbi:hypothetical protein [Brevundimonas sp. Leaf280]|uniref:hypothetical protein n=1 Tax=Brevundimonas sp. Leaf280 TaxID=1736320 RepID=UPI00138F8760|nr:hypothetical protein [Brevundimonas sp. Leaf280]
MSFLRKSVNDNFWRASARKRHADAFQLELPLGHSDSDEIRSFVALPLEEMHGLEILEAIRELAPSVIFDMREFPRFDISGTSRNKIFNEIDRAGSVYEQRPFPWSQVNILSGARIPSLMYGFKRDISRYSGRAVLFVSRQVQRDFLERELSF